MKTRLLLFAGLIALPSLSLAQAPAPAPTDAQTIFAGMKSLSGTWIGAIKIYPDAPHETIGDSMRVTLRVTSRGHVLVHEMQGANVPIDPEKYDHPVTMIYLDENSKLALVHYCDAGNRPRMTARVSPDGKTIDFDFVEVSGRYDRTGHMQHATFTLIDADHHVEDWTYLMPNNQTARAHIEMHREPVVASSSK